MRRTALISSLVFLFYFFCSWNSFAVLVVDQTEGHPGITVTMSNNHGAGVKTVGTIMFGTTQITKATHNLTAIKGQINSDQVVTDLNGDYKITFSVPDLPATSYPVQIGNLGTFTFNLTQPVLNRNTGYVGNSLRVSGFHGVAKFTIGTIQLDNGSRTITKTDNALKAIVGSISTDNKVVTDASGNYEVIFEIPTHVGGPIVFTLGGTKMPFTLLASITSITPKEVKYGDNITITGQGFSQLDTLTVNIGELTYKFPASDNPVNANGYFSVSAQIGDVRWQPTHDVTIAGNVSGNKVVEIDEVIINPSITFHDPQGDLGTSSGTANAIVYVTGRNFAGSGRDNDEKVSIKFDRNEVIKVGKLDFSLQPPGKFAISFVTAKLNNGGNLEIQAQGTISSPYPVMNFLYSLPDSRPKLEISKNIGQPELQIDVTGTGYLGDADIGVPVLKLKAANTYSALAIDAYVVGSDPGSSSAKIKTDTDGKFHIRVTIPKKSSNLYQIWINKEDANNNSQLNDGEDTNNNNQLDYFNTNNDVTKEFRIIPKLTVVAGQSKRVGQSFSVSGSGFGTSESVDIKLTADDVSPVPLTQIQADIDGNISSTDLKINPQTYGNKKIIASGITSQLTAVATETVQILNQITSASPNLGTNISVGQSITLAGNGWGTNEELIVKVNEFDGTSVSVELSRLTTDANGVFSHSLAMLSLGGTGVFKLTVTGTAITSSEAQTTLNRGASLLSWNLQGSTDYPIILIQKNSGQVGDTITAKATTNPGVGDVSFGSTTVTVDSSTPDGNGNFDIVFKVPEKPTGTHIIKYNKSEVQYTIGSKITNILPNSDVTVGQVVTAEGKGYPANSRIEVKFDSTVVATVISNSAGSFSAGFPLPVVAGSTSHQITAVATISGETATALTFPTAGNKVTGKVTSIQPVIGTTKTPVALSGNGFKSYQTVTIQFDGTDVLDENGSTSATFLTSEIGTLTATFYLPEKPSGTKQITVNGQASVGFTIHSSVSLDSKSAQVGGNITVTGNGFAASENLTFKVEDKTVDTTSAGADGKFSKAITIPRLGGGSRKLEVIGNNSSYATASFSVLGKITSVEPNGGTVQCGDEAIVTGEGFMPNEDIYIDFGTTQAIDISSGDTAARDDGTFTTKFRISTQPTGVKDLIVRQASGSSDSRKNAVQIVGQLTRLLINGKPRSESNKTIECSAELTLAGRGFTAGSDLAVVLKTTSDIDVTYKTHGLLNPVVRSDGTFVIVFNTNNLGADKGIDIQVKDIDKDITVSTRTKTDTDEEPDVFGGIDVVGRILTFTPLTGTADTEIEITGCGYHAGATVEVKTPSIASLLGSTTVESVSAPATEETATTGTEDEASGAGTYKVTFKFGDLGETVDLPLGPVTFTVSSTGGGFTITDTTAPFILSEVDSKRVDVTPLFGSSEDKVTIIGTGFPPEKEIGHITFDGQRISVTATGVGLINPISSKITTDISGVFQVLATVPAVTRGVKLVSTTDIPATTRGSFEVRKKLSIITPDTAAGYIGTEITVKGTGFNAAEVRALRFNGVHVTPANYSLKVEGIGSFTSNDRIQTDSLGRFKVKFVVPPIASDRPIMVTTDDGGIANFEAIPRISLVSPAKLKNGTAIRVVGDGFRSNESIVVDFGDPTQRSQFNADFLGQFDYYTQPVQLQTSGVKSLAIKGLDSSVEVNSYFYVEPSLDVEGVIAQNGTFVLGISSGKVGTFMRLRGKGFAKNDLVTLKIDNILINIDQNIISNKDGEFTADIKIPRIVGGTKEIIATGTDGDIASTTFTITAQLLSINGVAITPVGFTPIDVKVGDGLSIIGDGFLNTQTISFEVGVSGQGSLINMGMQSAGTDGLLERTFTIPIMSYGPKVVRLTTSAPTSQINIVGIRIVGRIKPGGISNRRSGFPEPVGSDNSSIYLWGDGFEENKPLTVTLTPQSGGNSVVITNENLLDRYGNPKPKTNSSGRFDEVEFKIPDPSGFTSGLVTVTVATTNTSTNAELIFSQVNSGGQLQISGSKRVTPDQRVQIRGFGYDNGTDNSGVVVGQLELQTTTSSHTRVVAGLQDEGAGSYNANGIKTNKNGVFEMSFTIPQDTVFTTAGRKLVTTNVINPTQALEFEIIPKLTVIKLSTTKLQVKGIGFAPGQPNQKIQVGSTSTGENITANVYGSFLVETTFPDIPAGDYQVSIDDGFGESVRAESLVSVTGTANITNVQPKSGPVGTLVTVDASGFAPDEKINSTFGSMQLPIVQANQQGQVSFSFAVDQQMGGNTEIRLTAEQTSLRTTTANFKISGQLTLVSEISGPKGTPSTIKGNGYNQKEKVQVFFGNFNLTSNAGVNRDGSISFDFLVPNHPRGAAVISVNIIDSNTQTTSTQTAIFSVESSISLSSKSAPVGATLGIIGSGFKPDEEVRIFVRTDEVKANADSGGSFRVNYEVPELPNGKISVIASSIGIAETANEFTVIPRISFNKNTGQAGEVININGTGFNPRKNIKIQIGQQSPAGLSNIDISEFGSFGSSGSNLYNFSVPAVTQNAITIRADNVDGTSFLGEDLVGGGVERLFYIAAGTAATPTTPTQPTQPAQDAVTLNITDNSDGNNDPTDAGSTDLKARAGDALIVAGAGFGANESVTLVLGSQSSTTPTTGAGSFVSVFVISPQNEGLKTLTATGNTSGKNKSTAFTILPDLGEPSFTITDNSDRNGDNTDAESIDKTASIGDTVTISGSGYGVNEQLRIEFGEQVITANTSSDATFETTFIAADQADGSIVVKVIGQISTKTVSDTFTLAPLVGQPSLVITDNSDGNDDATDLTSSDKEAKIGDIITLRGTNFGPNEEIGVDFGNQSIFANASGEGEFVATFVILKQIGGTKSILVKGKTSQKSKTDRFTIKPQITAFSPTIGDIGQKVTLQGDGYSANSQLTVRFGDSETSLMTLRNLSVQSTSDGSFSFEFSIPIGPYIVTPDADKRINSFIRINDAANLTTGTVQFVKINMQTASLEMQPTQANNGERTIITGLAVTDNGAPLANTNLGFLLIQLPNGTENTITAQDYQLKIETDENNVPVGRVETNNSIKTDAIGRIKASFLIPTIAGGQAKLRFTSVDNLQAELDIVPKVVTPVTGVKPGDAVAIIGLGYKANDIISARIAGGAILRTTPMTIKTDASGTFNAAFVVPEDLPGGAFKIIVTDSTNSDPNSIPTIQSELTILGSIDQPTASSQFKPGEPITLIGKGLGANETLSVTIGGISISFEDEVKSTATGNFELTITTPPLAQGKQIIRVDGQKNAAETEISVVSGDLTITPSEGSVGTAILVTGAGYPAYASVQVDLGFSEDITYSNADANGNINAKYLIKKPLLPGDKTLSIQVGGKTYFRPFAYVLDNIGPAILSASHDGGNSVITGASIGKFVTIKVIQRDNFDIAARGTYRIGGDTITPPLAEGELYNNGLQNDEQANDTTWGFKYQITSDQITKAEGLATAVPITVTLFDSNGNKTETTTSTPIQIDTEAEILSVTASVLQASDGKTKIIRENRALNIGDTFKILVVSEANAIGTFQIKGITEPLPLSRGNFETQYVGEYMIRGGDRGINAEIKIEMTDENGNVTSRAAKATITIETSFFSAFRISPLELQSGDRFTVEYTTNIQSKPMLFISDSVQDTPSYEPKWSELSLMNISEIEPARDEIEIFGSDQIGSTVRRYLAYARIPTEIKLSGTQHLIRIEVTDTDGKKTVKDLPVEFQRPPEFSLEVPEGVGMIHIPLSVELINEKEVQVETVGDVYDVLGGKNNVNLLITFDTEKRTWRSYLGNQSRNTSADKPIADDTGIITVMKRRTVLSISGSALGNQGQSQIQLRRGLNLIGVPLQTSQVSMVSDLLKLPGMRNNATSIIVATNGEFKVVTQPGDDGDVQVTGGKSFIVAARTEGQAEIIGSPWQMGPTELEAIRSVATSPSTQITDQTPVFSVNGQIKERNDTISTKNLVITIHNRTTNAILTSESRNYQVTFVDMLHQQAAKVGDYLEVSATIKDNHFRINPIEYQITAEDIACSSVQLPNLYVHEVPTHTKLFANYPNPFNPETWIPYQLSSDGETSIQIHNVDGQLVRSVELGYQSSGTYTQQSKAAYWDGRNDNGETVAGGIYFYTLKIDNSYVQTRKMIVVK